MLLVNPNDDLENAGAWYCVKDLKTGKIVALVSKLESAKAVRDLLKYSIEKTHSIHAADLSRRGIEVYTAEYT